MGRRGLSSSRVVIACPLDDSSAPHHVPGFLGVGRSSDEVCRGKGETQCSSGQQKCLEISLPLRWGLSSAQGALQGHPLPAMPSMPASSPLGIPQVGTSPQDLSLQGQHLMAGLRAMVFAQHRQHQAPPVQHKGSWPGGPQGHAARHMGLACCRPGCWLPGSHGNLPAGCCTDK